MKNFYVPGKMITVILAVAVVSGAARVIGGLFGIAAKSGGIGEEVEFALEGVYSIPKTAAQAYTLGQILYFDAATSLITSTVASNAIAGYAYKAALAADVEAFVLIGHK